MNPINDHRNYRLTPAEFKKAIEVSGLLLMWEMGCCPGHPRIWQMRLKHKLLEIYPGCAHEDLELAIFQAEEYTSAVIRQAVNAAQDAKQQADEMLRSLSKRKRGDSK